MNPYERTCHNAAVAQGLGEVMEVFEREGVKYLLENTGGFIMAVVVRTTEHAYVVTDDGVKVVGKYTRKAWDEEGSEPVMSHDFDDSQSAAMAVKLAAWADGGAV